jgi:DNA recombination protein RmuC
MDAILIPLAALLLLALAVLLVFFTRNVQRRGAAEGRLGESQSQIQALGQRLDAAESARRSAERELATTRQQLAEAERRNSDVERMRQESLTAAKAAALETTQHLSNKLLEDHKRENAAAKQEAETRVREATQHLVKQVEDIAKAVSALNGQVQDKSKTLDTVWRALSSPGGAGQLAEISLANTLKAFGLEAGRDYVLQLTTQDEASGRRLRPDAVVFLPADSALVIDCKASKFLVDIAAAEGTPAEADAYHNLARTMNGHLKALADKDYKSAVLAAWRNGGRAGEVTRVLSVMYLPNEAALEKLLRADPEFPRKAREAQIIPAGPAGLYCALSLAAVEINTLRQIENQQRIAEQTKSLLDAVVLVLGHAATVGKGLKAAADGFAKLTGSVNLRLLPRARSLGRLGLTPGGKPLPGNLAAYAVTSLDGDALIEGEAAEVAETEAELAPRLIAE